jgi:carbon-monoxide dehydrogenase medium subunit
MLSTEFDFFAPTELSEALALLDEHGDGAKVLSGGMSMMPAMNLGILRPSAVVSLNHLPSLDYIREDGDRLLIGCMTRHEQVATDPLVTQHLPLLAQAASCIADVQIRHRGTIGGSVAHADPAADYLPVVVVADATFKLASVRGERTVAAGDFFVDVMMTSLEPGEILVEIQVPKLSATSGSAYARLVRVEGSFAIVNAAAIADGDLALAIGGATPAPVVVDLSGADAAAGPTPELLDEVGQAAYEACDDAYGDLNGSEEYRRAMARVYARRAVAQALAATTEAA